MSIPPINVSRTAVYYPMRSNQQPMAKPVSFSGDWGTLNLPPERVGMDILSEYYGQAFNKGRLQKASFHIYTEDAIDAGIQHLLDEGLIEPFESGRQSWYRATEKGKEVGRTEQSIRSTVSGIRMRLDQGKGLLPRESLETYVPTANRDGHLDAALQRLIDAGEVVVSSDPERFGGQKQYKLTFEGRRLANFQAMMNRLNAI